MAGEMNGSAKCGRSTVAGFGLPQASAVAAPASVEAGDMAKAGIGCRNQVQRAQK